MALFRKFFYRKPPDGLLEISERVYVFDCCYTTDVPLEDEYKVYIGGIVSQLSDHFPDAAFMVFNFREGEQQSKIARILSEYDMTVMDYPRQYEGCPLLTMEVIHHFLRSSESWLSLGQQNILLMHCDRGGWPVLAFMLAALLIYRKNYVGEQKTLDMIYKQAPSELLQLMSPLNPLPSQMRYLQYVSRRNVGSEWPPLDRALTLDCIIIRFIPDFDGEFGCRPIFRIYGQDPFMAADRTPKVLFSTPKKSKLVRYYKQADCAIVKIDIHCYIQGDVVLECISLDSDLEREQMMFRFMFNTAFIRSNILILNRDEIDILWGFKDKFPKDFRVEVLFSEMDATSSLVPIELPHIEEKEGLPVEAFAKVQEIFNSLDWLDSKSDIEDVLQQITVSNFFQEKMETARSPQSAEKLLQQLDPEKLKVEQKEFLGNDMKSAISVAQEYQPSLSSELPEDENFNKKKIEPQDLQIAPLPPSQSKILPQQVPHSCRPAPLSHCNSLQGSPLPILRYHSAPSSLGITALLHDHAAPAKKEPYCSGTISMTMSGPVPSVAKVPKSTETSALHFTQPVPTIQQSPLSEEVSMDASPSKEKTTSPSHYHHVPFSHSKSTPSVLRQHSESTSCPPSPIKEKTAALSHHLPMLFSQSKSTQAVLSQHSESTSLLGLRDSTVLSLPPSAPSLWEDINCSLPVPGLQSSTPSPGGSFTSTSNCSILNPPPSPPAPPPPLRQPFPSSDIDSSFSANHRPPPTLSRSYQTSTVKDSSKTPPVPTLLPPSKGRPPSEKVLTSLATSVSPPPIPSTTVMSTEDTSAHPRPPPPPVNAGLASGPSVMSLTPPPPPPPPPGPSIIFPVPSPPPPLTSGTSVISSVHPPEPSHPPLAGTYVSSVPPPPPPGTPIVSSVPPPPPPLPSGASVISSVPKPPPPPGTSFVSSVPPPPPLPIHSSSNPMVNSSVPPPSPPPACPVNHTKAPSVPPPPPPNGFPKSAGISHSGVSNGNVPPVPGLPSGALFTAKGRGMSRTSLKNQAKRSNLKPYHWLKLTRAMQGSLWAEAQKPDEASKAPEFDMSELESLFSAAAPSSDPGSKGGKNRGASGPNSERVQLIELRRANNCEIMLTKVKVPLPELMGSVLALDESALDVDQVENLIKFSPTKEEMDLLKGYSGDKAKLGKCELFFLELMKVPRVESKLRVFAFKIQFQTQVSDLRRNLNIVNSASEEIRNSIKLKRIMQTILSLGNALNHGTARGSSIGFRLDSLLKLTDTRARNSRITLMHYLCKVLAEKLPELLDFSQDLLSLEASTKMQLKLLAEEMQAINKGLEKVVQELTAAENDGAVSEIFCKTLKEFLSVAEAEVRSLASLYSNVGRSADALALYFGEDPARCTFEQVVSTLLNFVRMFKRAHEENCKQLEIEKKKVEKEADNEQLKLATKNEAEQVISTPFKSSPVN